MAADLMVREKGFTLMTVPVLVREAALIGTGFFPAGRDTVYDVDPGEVYSEVTECFRRASGGDEPDPPAPARALFPVADSLDEVPYKLITGEDMARVESGTASVAVQTVIPSPICAGVFGIARTMASCLSADRIVSIVTPAMIDITVCLPLRVELSERPAAGNS